MSRSRSGRLNRRGHLKLARYADAIADYNAETEISPGIAYSLYGRGVTKRMTGDAPGGDADIAAAVVINSKIADELAKFDIRP